MVLSRSDSARVPPDSGTLRCSTIRDLLVREGLFQSPTTEGGGGGFVSAWRITPTAFRISSDDLKWFEALGPQLLSFYRALNRLYHDSVRGNQPSWVAAYLDQGKPESLVTYGRMNRFKSLVPTVIRPDVLPSEGGMKITELDSVPGGIGLTGCLGRAYGEGVGVDEPIVGGPDGMVQGFGGMLRRLAGARAGVAAIVVSEEAKEYRPEMQWLARELSRLGVETSCLEPRQVRFTEDGLWLSREGRERPIRVLYRFFELFDLKNVPKSELIMYSVKKEQVVATPPFKPALEEKLAFALFHHPLLSTFWRRELGEETQAALAGAFPRTWILDPRPIPPTAVVPDLTVGGRPVGGWNQLAQSGQRDRQLVIKPSGFSESAWGSRGVSVGHDLSQTEWNQALEAALAAFEATPHIVQEFHKSRSVSMTYYDPQTDRLVEMHGRVRLCPYYFVDGDRTELGGMLATVCPADKKIIHGMRDAIMAPCTVAQDARPW